MRIAPALVFYDHACTLSEEIEYIWERKMSSVIILFHLNRWSIFFWAILNFVNFMSLVVWAGMTPARQFRAVLTVRSVFSAVRIYAISGRRWQLAAVIFGLSIVPIGTNMVLCGLRRNSIRHRDTSGSGYIVHKRCLSLGTRGIRVMAIITRLCLITADILILLVTWYKTYAMMKVARQNNIRAPLAAMLLEDGKKLSVYLIDLSPY
ncbi:hypothetical protein OBBRIDRAFT_739193 [Obba rivulosa]|uniref:DUF6533 domain-containing protein n=1 Tax=Obba rivulosa TaxID=1052685 RepID=A0A8E2DKH8_9APHY|nr:hypothetical protein OBBRIDRAFT_739193 [Obba rivulosa]